MLFVTSACGLIIKYAAYIPHLTISQGVVLFTTTLLAAAYYKSNLLVIRGRSLREMYWLKPIVIGLVWTGFVFILPILFTSIIHNDIVNTPPFTALLFLKSVLFIGILAILFDIKDVQSDIENKMNTLILKLGFQRTLSYVILPLILLELIIIITNFLLQNLLGWQMILILIPFGLLTMAVFHLRKKRVLLFYLIGIDGLMLIKAVCGIIVYSSITFS